MKVQNASSRDSCILSFYLLPWTQLLLTAAGFLAAKLLFCKIYSYFREKIKYEICITLQTSQNFLIQKMLQKTLKICVIMPVFFDPENGGKI